MLVETVKAAAPRLGNEQLRARAKFSSATCKAPAQGAFPELDILTPGCYAVGMFNQANHQGAETMATSTRTRSTKTQAPEVTITDEQYKELLAIRLTAKHGFEAEPQTVSKEDYLKARAAVRRARKIRESESEQLEALREFEAAQEAEKVAKAEARKASRKPRTRKTPEPQPEAEAEELADTSEADQQTEAEVSATE